MVDTLSSRIQMRLISLVVVAILGLQAGLTFRVLCPPTAYPILLPLRSVCAPALWPIMDYPMYREPQYEDTRYDQFSVIGILADSSQVEIEAEDLDMGFWHFRRFIDALVENDRAEIDTYVEMYQNKYNQTLVELRLESHPLALSRQGFEPRPVEIQQVIRFEKPE